LSDAAQALTPPPKPLAIRALNAAGGALRALGLPLVRLDEASLLAEASRKTGLDDFGDARFREPLRLLLDSFEREAALTTLGRVIARRDVLRLLENRLRMESVHRAHPEITAAPVPAPLFVVGLPRTGTSILHELLAQDPDSRVPMSWETQHPWPPPELATYDTDPRIADVDAHLAGVDRILPDFKKIHPMGARLPQECVALTAHDFATMINHTTHRVPTYQRWLDTTDLRWVYASHRRQLQYLQWKVPARRWVLKSPGHLWALDALATVYPDANIVQTHRDPLKVVASLTSLVTVLRSLASDTIDPYEIAQDWTHRLAMGLERAMDVRARGAFAPAQVFDVHFPELMADPIAMIRRIYAHFDMTLSSIAEGRMRAFLASNAADKHGTHRYTLGAAGLDMETERRRYARYQKHFGIASEPMR
jgi:sulfotransferase family protein